MLGRDTVFSFTLLIALSLACVADTDLSPQQVIDMIERYENLYDECKIQYSSRGYTYESYLLGDEEKLEPDPNRTPISVTYYSKGPHQRIDILYYAREPQELRRIASDGDWNVSWYTTEQSSAGDLYINPEDEVAQAGFPVRRFRPFYGYSSFPGLQTADLKITADGSRLTVSWPTKWAGNRIEMSCERWGEYLRPHSVKSVWSGEDQPDTVAHEVLYYYGVDKDGEELAYPTKIVELSHSHKMCGHHMIEDVDFAPQFDSSVFEFEPEERTRIHDRTEGFIGKEAPELSAAAWVNLKPVTLASLRGNPIVLAFWDSADESSAELITAFNSLATEHRDLTVIAVHSADSDQPSLQKLAEKQHAAFRIVIDEEVWGTWPGATFRKYRVKEPPAVFIIDAEGKVRFQDIPLEAAAEALKGLLDGQ